jgi:hypothetical protein
MTTAKKIMRVIKYVMMALGLIVVVLSLVYNVLQYGGHGIAVFVLSLVPVALGGVSIKLGGMPRWASAASMVAFFVVAAKTSGGSTDLQNIMVAAFFGAVLSLVLLIVPDRPKESAAGETAPPNPGV